MSVVLRDLFSVTLYPPHMSLLCDKEKKESYVDFQFFTASA